MKNNFSLTKPLIILIGLLSFLLTLKVAYSQAVHVDKNSVSNKETGTAIHPFQTIQKAATKASNNATISISNEHYFEELVIDKPLTIVAPEGDVVIGMPYWKDHTPVTLFYPNGDEIWKQGKTYDIRWEGGDLDGKVNIKLIWYGPNREKKTFDIIEREVPNLGFYSYTVPKTIFEYNGGYKIEISTLDGTMIDESDDFFGIDPFFNLHPPGFTDGGASGFTEDFKPYNLFYFSFEDVAHVDFTEGLSAQGRRRRGQFKGNVIRRPGVNGNDKAIQLRGNHVEVDEGMPNAFAIDFWLKINNWEGPATLVSQRGNFKLNAFWQSTVDDVIPFDGIVLYLSVFNDKTKRYHNVASTWLDGALALKVGYWQHIVAFYDGHFKARIYVDGLVNEKGISSFERSLNVPIDYQKSPDFPRIISPYHYPVLIGAELRMDQAIIEENLYADIDEFYFSDISRYRVNDENSSDLNNRPGDHGATGNYYNYYHHPCGKDEFFRDLQFVNIPFFDNYTAINDNPLETDFQFYRWLPEKMHKNLTFWERMPYLQNVTDYSAWVIWRRQCEREGQYVDSQNPGFGKFHSAFQICYGEAGKEMKVCDIVTAEELENDYSVSTSYGSNAGGNYPDCQYKYQLKNLRPSTQYHYKVVELMIDVDENGMPIGSPFPIEQFVESLTDNQGNLIEELSDCMPTGLMRRELVSDAHFRTAPLANEDQVEIIAFGDTGPLVCSPDLANAGELRSCYWLQRQDDDHEKIWGPVVPRAINIYTMFQKESPSLWLSPGDLAQTKYNDHVFEAYLFGMFNKVWWNSWDAPTGFYNGMMSGVPLYASPGNHEWEADFTGGEYFQGLRSMSEMMENLFPPLRSFSSSLNSKFMYPNSSYSFDFGNMHIVSLCISCGESCEHQILEESVRKPVDQSCPIADWDYEQPNQVWKEVDDTESQWFDSPQLIWLKRDLWQYKDDQDLWKIVMLHVPIDGVGKDKSKLARFFEIADVDLVLVGHKHKFELANTGQFSSILPNPSPSEDYAIHLIVGTGGYVADQDADGAWVIPMLPGVNDHIPDHVGVPRLFVDGNMMLIVFKDLKNGGLWCTVHLKGVPDINKSEPFQPLRFPTYPCEGKQEGDIVEYFNQNWNRTMKCRCLKPHTEDPEITGTNGVWGPSLRAIPIREN